ncbi:hypothetical protein [Aquabacterium sp.]|uniref:hypothetical protein n=1 Tax=Aquabacterium sp. TaxID=1872578 RepID=UPI00378443F9
MSGYPVLYASLGWHLDTVFLACNRVLPPAPSRQPGAWPAAVRHAAPPDDARA